ncbi:hypothetical protein [Fructobacillus ficulneus]|uniref:DNA polymerase III delta prime subunit n=1 Tax=Fructobacillus ficulneus TaxID=157463 RepID=A0A0K8MH38_9LACO|nr:hypothetical protein [Fructobacillus ficulneus]GAO99199.1 DNA polymerase III delta prime subunit [Fructobacillus ficulneus]
MAKQGKIKGANPENNTPVLADTDFLGRAERAYPDNFGQFQQVVAEDRLSHLYLIGGPGQEEKLALAQSLASFVLGRDSLTKQRIAAFDHPDFITVLAEKPGAAIKIAQIRALVPELTTTALEGSKKIFVIDQVETLTTAAANSLLKFIEEPAGPQLILLLTNRVADVLPTIKSRAQLVTLHASDAINQSHVEARQEFLNQAQPIAVKWFEKAMRADVSLMAYLQQELLPMVTTGEQEGQVLAWLQALGRDLTLYSYVDKSQLNFPNLVGFYQKMNQTYTADQLLQVSELILEADKLRTVNISWQSRLEKLGLEMTMILG